ncbi:MAG: aminomethyl-transferring glycine dehydrogenase subunit GcvPA [Candidatus Aureabacteria bacterium]|nr:aminomethyl-transferring glycine dehydrogenase subunit GcvPA [Candidatus Auribacterota bacterium]
MHFTPHSESIIEEMLKTIGVLNFEELIRTVPSQVRCRENWDEPGLKESDVRKKYRNLAEENEPVTRIQSYLGGGVYEHFIPSVVNHLASRPEFVTSYTQYQPESNQGMLQGLFEYQTLLCRLTGMDVSNSSHYDGATSLAEAVLMALRNKPGKILYSKYLHPHYTEVLKTYLFNDRSCLFEVTPYEGTMTAEAFPKEEEISAVIVQSPNFLGIIEDMISLSEWAHARGAVLIAVVNPVSLGMLEAPGNLGADMVVGEGQPLGNSLSFGGPYFGFMCVKKEWMRKMPGRIVGQTADKAGRRGFVLTLQTREQHIRREKAVSNICSNEALCALRAAIYLAYLGETGFKNLSEECFEKAHLLQEKLSSIPGLVPVYNKPFFNEFAVRIKHKKIASVLSKLRRNQIAAGIRLNQFYHDHANDFLIAVTETKTAENLDYYYEIMKEVLA